MSTTRTSSKPRTRRAEDPILRKLDAGILATRTELDRLMEAKRALLGHRRPGRKAAGR